MNAPPLKSLPLSLRVIEADTQRPGKSLSMWSWCRAPR